MEAVNLNLCRQLRHELHQHPELANKEYWTKQHLISFLTTNTKLKIVDNGSWFYAIYYAGESKESIAFRADFDAVPIQETIDIPYASLFPGAAHKCGHDGHAASLAGLALEIDQKGADKNIFFLFQHAEETGEGAVQCVSFIERHNIKEIFAYHNMSGMELNSINVIEGTAFCASKGMTIRLEGAPAHASEPEKGVNPAFAIAKIIDAIPGFSSLESSKGMVLCTVIQIDVGERAFGISASKGDLLLTIRASDEMNLEQLQNNLEKITLLQAGKYGLKVSFFYHDVFPETANHKESVDKIRQIAKRSGFKIVEAVEPVRASEDFGHYLKRTKGAICCIGNGKDYPPLHSCFYDFPDEIIETAVELFKGVAAL